MGYYTDFHLSIETLDRKPVSHRMFHIISEYMKEHSDFWRGADLEEEINAKWYDHSKDMREVSEEYPDYIFVLTGYGEDKDDIWRSYYWQGREQHERAQIVFGEFNPKLCKLLPKPKDVYNKDPLENDAPI